MTQNIGKMKLYLLKFSAFYFACLTCWILQTQFGFSPVLSSALIGFSGSFVPHKGVQAVIYAGSFAGMCSPEYLNTDGTIFVMSIVGSSVYLFSKPHFTGFGGRLGTIAFISSVVVIMTRNLW